MRYQSLLTIFLIFFGLNGIVLSAELHGKVTNSETFNPIQGATVKLVSSDDSSADPVSLASDKHGEFEILYLPDGNYYLLTTHVAYDASDTLRLTLVDNTSIDITLVPSPWVLNEVVVTGTRSPHLLKDVPVQTEVVSERDFQRTGATTVDEALASSIGITINEDLSGQGATIRGIEGDRVLILIDGQRAVGRVNGAIDLGQFSLTNVKKIEIVKGTGSTLYGSDAMGGVINIITKKPTRGATKLAVTGDYGTHTTYNPSVSFDYGKTDWGFYLGAKLYSTAGFDLDKSTLHTNGLEDIDRWNFNTSFRRKLSRKWSTTLSGRFMWENKKWIEVEETPRVGGVDIYINNDDEVNKRYEGSVAFDYFSGDNYSMNFTISATRYDHQFNKFNGPFWVDTSFTQDKFIDLSYSSNYVIGAGHVATYGFNYNFADLVSPGMIDEKQADSTLSAYFQYEYSPLMDLVFLPGIRYEYHSSFGKHWNPSVNIMYSPSEVLKFRGFVGKGFRAPSIKQQYFVFDHLSAGYVVYGALVPLPEEFQNLLLHPIKPLVQESSVNSSISAEFSYGTMGLHRLTYFYNHLEGLIEHELQGFPIGYWRGLHVYTNIDRVLTQGIEWESRVRLSKMMDFSFSYNYLDARDLSDGSELRNRPKHTVKFYLTATNEPTGIGVSIWGDHHSKKIYIPRSNTGGNEDNPDLDEPPVYAPSRTRLNLNIFKKFGSDLEVFLRMENISGSTNVNYGYWPDREIFLGLKYNLIDR